LSSSLSTLSGLPPSISIVGEDGKASAGKPKKKYTMTGDMRAKRKARARAFQIDWWRDWTQHKKFRQQNPVEVPSVYDCPCGKSISEHPTMPNSSRFAINIFCPFVQMKRLGIM
jgi:hypothetical protein